MITTTKKRIRRDFAPLELFADIVTGSAGSGMTQVYEGSSGEHEPDRVITPLVLVPYVLAEARDGSYEGGDVREKLTNGQWYVNGVKIDEAAGWSGGYAVSSSAGTKWQLTVRKNLEPGETAELTFKAQLADTRTGSLIPVTCGPATLSCTERASDTWSLHASGDTIMLYDPLRDNLQKLDYMVAEGLQEENAATRQATEKEQTSYLRKLPLELWKGGEKWTGGWKLVAARIGADGGLARMKEGDDDLAGLDTSGAVMDLRLTEKSDILLCACVAAADAGTAGTDVPVSVGMAADEGIEAANSASSYAPGVNAVRNSNLPSVATGAVNVEAGWVKNVYGEFATFEGARCLKVINSGGFYSRANVDQPPAGATVVHSADVYGDAEGLGLSLGFENFPGASNNVQVPYGKWTRVTSVQHCTNDNGASKTYHIYGTATGNVYVKNIKCEIGDTPTPYSPAPSDELKCVARAQLSAERIDGAFSAEIQNTADIAAGDTRRVQRAVVSTGGGTAEHAESVLEMTWKTDTKAGSGTTVGYGRAADFALSETGLTEAYDDYLDVYLEMDDRGAMQEATDENGNILTDENGNTLIFAP